MKLFIHFVSIVTVLFIINTSSFAQCNVCNIDLTCDSIPAGPKICPYNLPPGTSGSPYEESFTFYLPTQFDITTPVSGTVTLNQVDVKSVTGVPSGLSWTGFDYTGAATTTFYPAANPPATERGCAMICGTPLVPGNYVVTITVDAHVKLGAIDQVSEQSFTMNLVILPNPSGNSAFTMSADRGCDTVKTVFEPVLQSSGSDLYEYNWTFGNGTTSTEEFPVEVIYDTPGEYVIEHTTKEFQYAITDVSLTSTDNTIWCNDPSVIGGEAGVGIGFCSGSPDIFFTMLDGSGNTQTSPRIDGVKTPSWSNLNLLISGGSQVTLNFIDFDSASSDDSLGVAVVDITGTGNYPISGIGFSGSITIDKIAATTLSDKDTITVIAPPAITATTITPGNKVCGGDSVLLSTSTSGSYQWFMDSTEVFGADTNKLWVKSAGRYYVKVTNDLGCSALSTEDTISIINNPPVPQIIRLGDELKTFVTGVDFQWYLDGNPIPGATNNTHVFTATGNYNLKVTKGGCETWAVAEVPVVYEPPTSIFESKETVKFVTIIPNPNNGKFSLAFQSFENTNVIYQIIDLSGRTVFEKQLNSIYGKYREEIDLSMLRPGIYFVRLNSGEQNINKKLVIK